MNSDSAIFCFGKENMNSYKENKKRKDGAKGLTKCTANEFVQSLFSDSISIFLCMYFYLFPYTWGARWLLFFDLDFFAASTHELLF
jgi:hypothetical protein